MASPLKVLIADDSPTARHHIAQIINATPDMRVIGEAHSGKQAVQLTQELRPDVILMDVVMPGMNGLEATREIMSATPTPIVMIGANLENQETDVAMEALRTGALSVLKKPVSQNHPDFRAQSQALVSTVRAMAGVSVIHHRKTALPVTAPLKPIVPPVPVDKNRRELVAIASSTGGPAALAEIFRGLPPTFALPVVVAQHISNEFLPSLVQWLSTTTRLKVEIARAGDIPQPGHIYFAPADAHLLLRKNHRFEVDRVTQMTYTPSGDILLESVAAAYGANAMGVVLTGMGNDGARGLRAMRSGGAYTIAQDEATSVIFGMPQEAIAMGGAVMVLPLNSIARTIAVMGSSTRGLSAGQF